MSEDNTQARLPLLRRPTLRLIVAALPGTLFLLAVAWLNGALPTPTWVAWALGFSLLALALAVALQSWHRGRRLLFLTAILWLLGMVCYAQFARSLPAGIFFTLLAGLIVLVLFAATLTAWHFLGIGSRWGSLLAALLLAGFAVSGAVLAAQIEARFSDEEFFALLQAAILFIYWLILAASLAWAAPLEQTRLPRRDRLLFAALAILVMGIALVRSLRAYQSSFFPLTVPAYPSISAGQPFLCETLPLSPSRSQSAPLSTPDPITAFNTILDQIAANPYAGAPEWGMLALAGREGYAARFHDALLADARLGKYTGPAGSVKYGQHDAALRAHYYSRLRVDYPGLFSSTEQQEITQWLRAVNRRSLTVEPVDWMYALAFNAWPLGPYENQENGAGLLAVLEAEGLGDPTLTSRNREYLSTRGGGWQHGFRNTDDAFFYQPEWITNAIFQASYRQNTDFSQVERSFDWLLLQALPGGMPLRYNHPAPAQLADTLYLGAELLADPQLLWAAGQAAQYAAGHKDLIFARPGLESAFDLLPQPPETGSCLIYGDSGLPTRRGPLAPDKIVLRDGWQAGDRYLLANLRFTGWHRYKASGTIPLIVQDAPLVGEVLEGADLAWLPAGRSQFRDKRIPRQNLNGLLIERSGLGAALEILTGIGSPWAQDPPFYATVETFQAGETEDRADIRLDDWRGWSHSRSLRMIAGGPILVIDEASGPAGSPAALVWHAYHARQVEPGRYRLEGRDSPAEIILIPRSDGQISLAENPPLGDNPTGELMFSGRGQLSLISVFLTGEWAEAQVTLDGDRLLLSQDGRNMEISLEKQP